MFHNLEIPHVDEDHPEAVTVDELRSLICSMEDYMLPLPQYTQAMESVKEYIVGNLRPNQVWGWVINCAYTLGNMQPMLDTDAGLSEVSLFITMKTLEVVAALELLDVDIDLPFVLGS